MSQFVESHDSPSFSKVINLLKNTKVDRCDPKNNYVIK